MGGWRSLLSSERSPRARVLANDGDGAARAAGWADAAFDDGEWDLPALGKGAKGFGCCRVRAERRGAAPQPVWAPTVRQHAWFRFRVVEANRTAT